MHSNSFFICFVVFAMVSSECQQYRYQLINETVVLQCRSNKVRDGIFRGNCEFPYVAPHAFNVDFLCCRCDADCPSGFRCGYDFCFQRYICRSLVRFHVPMDQTTISPNTSTSWASTEMSTVKEVSDEVTPTLSSTSETDEIPSTPTTISTTTPTTTSTTTPTTTTTTTHTTTPTTIEDPLPPTS